MISQIDITLSFCLIVTVGHKATYITVKHFCAEMSLFVKHNTLNYTTHLDQYYLQYLDVLKT